MVWLVLQNNHDYAAEVSFFIYLLNNIMLNNMWYCGCLGRCLFWLFATSLLHWNYFCFGPVDCYSVGILGILPIRPSVEKPGSIQPMALNGVCWRDSSFKIHCQQKSLFTIYEPVCHLYAGDIKMTGKINFTLRLALRG